MGEIDRVDAFTATLALGGARDVFGFVDLSAGQKVEVPVDELVFGQRAAVGPTLVYARVPISCASLSRG